ncbi:hypothetical protein Ahy_B03g063777 isoform F [Arachis hypogaea]|uniref:Uncharacterized protein n=1 Tax=Arachis hypogaea TaxID=3818 RepID=A0A444ZYG3_ARAHY|nr:hypothetical protein Ahy_B03g063777 isoform F [Arachis hypogaea]
MQTSEFGATERRRRREGGKGEFIPHCPFLSPSSSFVDSRDRIVYINILSSLSHLLRDIRQ